MLPVEQNIWAKNKSEGNSQYDTVFAIKTAGWIKRGQSRRWKYKRAYLELFSEIFLMGTREERTALVPSVRMNLAWTGDAAGGSKLLTSTTALMTDGRPRRTSLCSFSVKHNGTLPTRTRGAPAWGSSSCRPRPRRGDWQPLETEDHIQLRLMSFTFVYRCLV